MLQPKLITCAAFLLFFFWRCAGSALQPCFSSSNRSIVRVAECEEQSHLDYTSATKDAFTSPQPKTWQGYFAHHGKIAGVNTQGRTLAEARGDLKEALEMPFTASREEFAT